jgi:hypothetical protein
VSEPLHVYPLHDLHQHKTEGEDCPCHPRIEHVYSDDGKVYRGKLIIHNSFDGRELLERKYGEIQQ